MNIKVTAAPAGESAAHKNAPETVKVKLTKPHTHAGKEYGEGETISVTASQKAFLERAGVIPAPKTEEK